MTELVNTSNAMHIVINSADDKVCLLLSNFKLLSYHIIHSSKQ